MTVNERYKPKAIKEGKRNEWMLRLLKKRLYTRNPNAWKKWRKGRENAIRKGVERIMPFVRNNIVL